MIHHRRNIILVLMLFGTLGLAGGAQDKSTDDKYLRIYGCSGPQVPIKECAKIFSQYHGIKVSVVGGPEEEWIDQARQDADIVYAGAEYMLTQFDHVYPDLIDRKTRTSLYERSVGILVRQGNPRRVKSISDLSKPGIRILDVVGADHIAIWEDIAGAKELTHAIQKNIILTVTNSHEAVAKWLAMPGIDAWVTFETWHHRLEAVSDLVQLPNDERISRGTPIAITKGSRNREMATKFINFLKTEPSHTIFQKWGWK